MKSWENLEADEFQSTLSVRRATDEIAIIVLLQSFQSTLSVRRATFKWRRGQIVGGQFQSTLSVRRATCSGSGLTGSRLISIHALREESDRMACCSLSGWSNFNPRSP